MKRNRLGFPIPVDGEGQTSTHYVYDEVQPITYAMQPQLNPVPVQLIDASGKTDTVTPNIIDTQVNVLDIPPGPVPIVYPTPGDAVVYETEPPIKYTAVPPVVCTDCDNATASTTTRTGALEWIKTHPSRAALIAFAVYYLFNENYKKT
jgi:hypothetical protein